jgi:predicted NBD/HSP70 family sugar kinase
MKTSSGMDTDTAYIIGMYLTEYCISSVVVDFKEKIVGSLEFPHSIKMRRSAESRLAEMERALHACIDAAGVNRSQISGIGIGLPGFIDAEENLCHWSPLFETPKKLLFSQIQHRFKVPTLIENDGIAATMMQKRHGSGRDVDNFILVTLEDVVGMGLVINGRIYRGHLKGYGQFGHTVVVPGGIECFCGKKGCIEAYVGALSIIKAVRRICAESDRLRTTLDQFSLEDLIKAAKRGETTVADIFHQAGAVLGLGISGLVQTLCPKKIIISGRMTLAQNLLFDPMQEALKIYVNENLLKMVEIIIYNWCPTDCAYGAAILSLKQVVNKNKNKNR